MTRSARTWLLLTILLALVLTGAWIGWVPGTAGVDPSATGTEVGPGRTSMRLAGEESHAPEPLESLPGTADPEASRKPADTGRSSASRADPPTTGVLNVRLIGFDGGREREPVRLSLMDPRTHGEDGDRVVMRPNGGPCSFEGLALDQEWTLFVQPTRVGPRALTVQGPSREQPEVEVPLRLADHFVRYRMRLVDEEGAPLVRRELSMTSVIHSTSGYSLPHRGTLVTDDEGVAERWGEGRRMGAARLEWRFSCEGRPGTDEPARHGARQLPRDPAPGLYDLGDVVLAPEAPEEVVASGRVVDVHGAGISDVPVQFQAARGSSGVARILGSARSDAAGRFEIRVRTGDPETATILERAESLFLQARHASAGFATRPIERGDVVELCLEPLGSVEGRLLVPEGVAPGGFVVQLDPESSVGATGSEDRRSQQASVRKDGTFQVYGLAPGRHELVVRSDTSFAVVHRIPGLVVPPGARCTDPRLAEIDLEPHLVRATLTILDADGEPVANGWWSVIEPGPDSHGFDHAYEGSTPELLLGPQPVTVRLVPDGHGPLEVPSVHGDTTVRLPARRSLVLRMHIEGAFDDTGLILRPVLRSSSTGRRYFWSEDALGIHEGLRFASVTPGTYALSWRATFHPEGSSNVEELPHRPQVDVVVPPGEGPCEVDVTVRAEDLLGIR